MACARCQCCKLVSYFVTKARVIPHRSDYVSFLKHFQHEIKYQNSAGSFKTLTTLHWGHVYTYTLIFYSSLTCCATIHQGYETWWGNLSIRMRTLSVMCTMWRQRHSGTNGLFVQDMAKDKYHHLANTFIGFQTFAIRHILEVCTYFEDVWPAIWLSDSCVMASKLSLIVPTFGVWAPNTGVGKTLVSVALSHAVASSGVRIADCGKRKARIEFLLSTLLGCGIRLQYVLDPLPKLGRSITLPYEL